MGIKLEPTEGMENMQGVELIHAVEALLSDFLRQAAATGMTAEEMRAAAAVKKQLRENRKVYGMEV